MNYWILIGIFGFLILFSFLLNLFRLQKSKKLLLMYKDYLENPTYDLIQETQNIKTLFKKAGIQAPIYPTAFPVGLSIHHGLYSTVDNLHIRNEEVISSILNSFHKTIGVYRDRMINSINPLFWVEFIFFLPKFLLEYLGVAPESIIIRLLQIIYWIFSLLFTIFKAEIIVLVNDWLYTLFS